MSYEGWASNLAIPWLNRPQGKAFAAAHGRMLDRQVDRLKQGIKARFPGTAPADALPVIAGERQLDRGPFETEEEFRFRLRLAWTLWEFGGTALGLLLALHFGGFEGAYLLCQGGKYHRLFLPLDWDDLPSALVTNDLPATPLGQGRWSGYAYGRDGGMVEGEPFFLFDTPYYPELSRRLRRDEFNSAGFTSRFAVVFSGTLPELMLPNAVTVTFDGTEDGSPENPWPTATWPRPFSDATYFIQIGLPTITDGGSGIALSAIDKTSGGCVVQASNPFAGTVELVAYTENPFVELTSADLERMRRIIKRWKPGRDTCTGIHIVYQGRTLGWPLSTLGSGWTLGDSGAISYTAE